MILYFLIDRLKEDGMSPEECRTILRKFIETAIAAHGGDVDENYYNGEMDTGNSDTGVH